MRRLNPLPLIILFLWCLSNYVLIAQEVPEDVDCPDCQSGQKYMYAMNIGVPEPVPDDEEDGGSILGDKFIKIINLGPVVNHEGVDYAPTVSADGKTLYYVSNRPGSQLRGDKLSHDFWKTTHATRLDPVFEPPVNLDTSTSLGKRGVNTILDEGTASIAADRQSLFFTGCSRPDGLGSCDIYFVEIEGDKWGKPINLGKNVNSKGWDSQPSIMYNKSRLYFASNRNKDGELVETTDIWYSDWDWDNEEWLPAKNFEAINTDENEQTPFIGTDGVTLFFASNGYENTLGGYDFYVTTLTDPENEVWSKPRNLGAPINTEEDEMFISLPASGDVIYFASRREDLEGYQGDLDIFMAFVPTFYRSTMLVVRVQDECSQEFIPADIEITNRLTGRVEKGKVSLEETGYSIVVANDDYGPVKDSNKVTHMIVKATNAKYGSSEKIATINKPSVTKDKSQEGDVVDADTVIITLGQRPVLGTIIEEADYVRRMKASQPELATYNGLVMEEVQTWDLYPLLNYVFFDLGSSELPDRYITFSSPEKTSNFADTTIQGGTLDKYYHILNIYGFRLKQHPDSKIEIVGCIDNKTPEEKNNTALSKERATLVYNYFRDIWGIDESRMKLTVRKAPQVPSTPTDSLGIQENRRVELICKDWEIYKPVFDKDPKTFPQPDEMIWTMKNGIEDGLVSRREIVITRGGQPWKTLKDIGITEPRFTWDWLDEDYNYPKDEVAYEAQLIVYSQTDMPCKSDPVTIPVMQVSTEQKSVVVGSDSTLENYSLILFPFNRYDPGPKNERIMSDYVYDRCKATSRIEVIGHTDVVGLDEHNLKLSQNRAGTVHQGIEKKTKGTYGRLNVMGVGEQEPLYSNSIPEGRFYNRTVNVIIRTPVEEYENK